VRHSGSGKDPAPETRSPVTSGPVFARNIAYSAVSQGLSLVLMIITIPIVVHGLGESAYGIFVVASLLLSYVGFLDLGLTPSVVRLVAIHYSTDTPETLSRIVGTALTLLLGLGALGGALIALLAPAIVSSVLHVPARLRADAIFVLDLAAVGFACNMCLTLFGAIPQALQRLDLFTMRSLILTAATAGGQIAAVVLGGGLRWVAGVTIAVNVASLGMFIVVARRLLPAVHFGPRLDRWALRQLVGFGSLRFVSQVSGQVVFQVDRLIVAAFLPIRAVTLYSVPLVITQKFTVIQFIFSGAFFPAASELNALGEHDRLQRLYLASLKLSFVLVLPMVILVAGFSYPILTTWVGRDFGDASRNVLIVLAVAYGIATLIGVPTLASDATGHVHWSAAFAVASAVINVCLTLLLVPRLGTIGAAYALLINVATQGIVFIYVVQRWFLHIPLWSVLAVLVRPLIAGAVLGAYSYALAPHIPNFAILLAALVLGGLLYAGMTALLGVWDDRERQLAQQLATGALSALRARLG
jgi:O-antigen/teichoic acid export membrane protein